MSGSFHAIDMGPRPHDHALCESCKNSEQDKPSRIKLFYERIRNSHPLERMSFMSLMILIYMFYLLFQNTVSIHVVKRQ